MSHLISMDLADNDLTNIPDALLQGVEYERINRGTSLVGNQLSPHSVQQLSAYRQRTGINFGLPLDVAHFTPAEYDSEIWLSGLLEGPRTSLQTKWNALIDEPGSEQFFELLDRLKTTKDFQEARENLIHRVQAILNVAAQDEAVRSGLFYLASHKVSCCDSVAFIFSSLEIEVLIFEARSAQDPLQVELDLVKLRRGQFRLVELDRVAIEDAKSRSARAEGVDELELRLSYRLALTKALQLPGQPKNMMYHSIANIEYLVIEKTRLLILAMNNSDEMLNFMTKESYWVEFLEERYPERFAANTMNKAEVDFEALLINEGARDEASNINFENWKRDRQTLLRALTLEALVKLDSLEQAVVPE